MLFAGKVLVNCQMGVSRSSAAVNALKFPSLPLHVIISLPLITLTFHCPQIPVSSIHCRHLPSFFNFLPSNLCLPSHLYSSLLFHSCICLNYPHLHSSPFCYVPFYPLSASSGNIISSLLTCLHVHYHLNLPLLVLI